MAAPFGPKAAVDAEAGDLVLDRHADVLGILG